MKSEKGITLTSLVIYILASTVIISTIAMFSSFFVSNISVIKNRYQYAQEFNKFSMFFIEDVKKNQLADVTETSVTFADGTIYEYNNEEKKIYRNDIVITEKLDSIEFTSYEEKVESTNKQIINVKMTIEGKQNAPEGIEYVLKYW